MKTIYILAVCALFASCSLNLHPDDENNLTSKFNGTWNIHEGIDRRSSRSEPREGLSMHPRRSY